VEDASRHPRLCDQKGGMAMKFDILKASRSFSNESEGKDMFGCLADDSGRVVCYFPTKSSFDSYSDKIKTKLEEEK
jgi:hypothetical protein